jgi:hypothetical protein
MPLVSPEEWFKEKIARHYDLDDANLNVYIEVKGTSNTDQLKFFEDQLDSQLEELGFPVDDGYIWLFAYRNRVGPHRGAGYRLLKHQSGDSWETLSTFLARNTILAYVVDVRLLDLLRKQNGTRIYSRDRFNLRNVVRINRTDLLKIANCARERLRELGVPSKELPRWLPPRAQRFRLRRVCTVLDGRAVSFRLILIVPNAFKRRFLHRLNGTVGRVEPR